MNSPSCVAYYHPTLPIDLLEVNRRLRECLTSTGPQVRVKPPDSASIGTPAPYNVDDPCSELRWQVRLVEDEIKHFEDNMQDTLDYWQNRLDLTSNIHQLMQAHQRKFRTDGRWYETAENSGVASLSEGQHSNGNQEPRVCATKASACSPWKREHDQIDASGGPSAMPMQKRARMEESTSVVAAYLTNQQTTPSTASETTAEFPPKSSIAEYEGSSILGSSSQMKMMVEPGQGLVDELKGQWWKVADSGKCRRCTMISTC